MPLNMMHLSSRLEYAQRQAPSAPRILREVCLAYLAPTSIVQTLTLRDVRILRLSMPGTTATTYQFTTSRMRTYPHCADGHLSLSQSAPIRHLVKRLAFHLIMRLEIISQLTHDIGELSEAY